MKCGSRSGEQQVKLKVTSSEHKNLQVSQLLIQLEALFFLFFFFLITCTSSYEELRALVQLLCLLLP